MGAVIVVDWNTSDPRYSDIINKVARDLEQATGEKVSVSVGIVNDMSAPNLIMVGRTLNEERTKIRL